MTLIKLPSGWKRSSAVKLYNDNLVEFLFNSKIGIWLKRNTPEDGNQWWKRTYNLEGLTAGRTYIIFQAWSTGNDTTTAKIRIPDTDAEILNYCVNAKIPLLNTSMGFGYIIIKAKSDTVFLETVKCHTWQNWNVDETLQIWSDAFETEVSTVTTLPQVHVAEKDLTGYITITS